MWAISLYKRLYILLHLSIGKYLYGKIEFRNSPCQIPIMCEMIKPAQIGKLGKAREIIWCVYTTCKLKINQLHIFYNICQSQRCNLNNEHSKLAVTQIGVWCVKSAFPPPGAKLIELFLLVGKRPDFYCILPSSWHTGTVAHAHCCVHRAHFPANFIILFQRKCKLTDEAQSETWANPFCSSRLAACAGESLRQLFRRQAVLTARRSRAVVYSKTRHE